MKMFIFALLILPLLAYGGDTNSPAKAFGEKWYSKPRLERIARDYAKQQKIAFDFSNTHTDSRLDSWHANVAIVDFYHGMHQPVFEAKIDPKGKVLEAYIATLEEPPPP